VITLRRPASSSILLAMSALLIFATSPANAKSWRPTKSVRIVVAFAAGGITDIMARLLAEHMQKKWGQTVVVENKTGAGGTIGTLEVVHAAPDGHTLLVGSTGPQGSAYSLFRNMPYQPKDITSITNVFIGSNILLVNNDLPVKTLPEFIEWVKKNDGRITYASAGVGSLTHLTGQWFFNLLGVKATHVPYRGSAPAMVDLMSGAVPVFFDSLANGMEFARSGKVRALAVTSADPNIYAKELPVIKGATPNLKDFVVDTFYGVFGPTGLPKDVIEEVNVTVKEWLALDASKKNLEKWAVVAAWAPHAETEAYVAAEVTKWRTLIEAEGIKLDLK
jgi:tripartite-type tricarboxylate transporter receptor subunit TctC